MTELHATLAMYEKHIMKRHLAMISVTLGTKLFDDFWIDNDPSTVLEKCNLIVIVEF